jgi:hypothetical protein
LKEAFGNVETNSELSVTATAVPDDTEIKAQLINIVTIIRHLKRPRYPSILANQTHSYEALIRFDK